MRSGSSPRIFPYLLPSSIILIYFRLRSKMKEGEPKLSRAVMSGPHRPVFPEWFFTLKRGGLCFRLVYGTTRSSRRFPGERHNFTPPFLKPQVSPKFFIRVYGTRKRLLSS